MRDALSSSHLVLSWHLPPLMNLVKDELLEPPQWAPNDAAPRLFRGTHHQNCLIYFRTEGQKDFLED